MDVRVESRTEPVATFHSFDKARPIPIVEIPRRPAFPSLQPPAKTPAAAAPAIRYSVVPFPQRIEEVLEVRRIARCAAGQNVSGTPAIDMFDDRDRSASIAIAEHEHRIVGTMRLTRPLAGKVLHSTNHYLGPVVGLPPSGEYLELSRACVHPDYQGHGILWHLTAQMLITAWATERRYLIGGANEEMARFWNRCGFHRTETVYRIPTAPGVDHFLIVLDLEEVLVGRGIDPKLSQALAELL